MTHFISILYDEGDQDSYRGVSLEAKDESGKLVSSMDFVYGDPVRDWQNAVFISQQIAGEDWDGVMMTSSCDHFVVDGDKYEFDDDCMLVKIQNNSKNKLRIYNGDSELIAEEYEGYVYLTISERFESEHENVEDDYVVAGIKLNTYNRDKLNSFIKGGDYEFTDEAEVSASHIGTPKDCSKELVFDYRQIQEIRHALIYKKNLNHGTDGHHKLILLANLAETIGFSVYGLDLVFSETILEIEEGREYKFNVEDE